MSLIKYILLNGRHLVNCTLGKIRTPALNALKHDKLKPRSRPSPSSQFTIKPYKIQMNDEQLVHGCMSKWKFSKPSYNVSIMDYGRTTSQTEITRAQATLSVMLPALNQSQQHLVNCVLENMSYLLGELKAQPLLVQVQHKNICRKLLQILHHLVNTSTSVKRQPLKHRESDEAIKLFGLKVLPEIQTSSYNTLMQTMRLILTDKRLRKHRRTTSRQDLFCPIRAYGTKQVLRLLDAVLVNAVRSLDLPIHNCLKEIVQQQIKFQQLFAASFCLPLYVPVRFDVETINMFTHTLNQILMKSCKSDAKKDIHNIKEQTEILDVNNKVFDHMEDYLKKIKIIKKPSDCQQDRKSRESGGEKDDKLKKFTKYWSIPEIKIDISNSIQEEVHRSLQIAIKNSEKNLRLKCVQNEIVEVANAKINLLRDQLIRGLEVTAKQVSNQVEKGNYEYWNRTRMGKYINNIRPREFQKLPQIEVPFIKSLWNSTPRVQHMNYELSGKKKAEKKPPRKLELVTEEIVSLTGEKIKVTRFKN